jgi:hypothetical protein
MYVCTTNTGAEYPLGCSVTFRLIRAYEKWSCGWTCFWEAEHGTVMGRSSWLELIKLTQKEVRVRFERGLLIMPCGLWCHNTSGFMSDVTKSGVPLLCHTQTSDKVIPKSNWKSSHWILKQKEVYMWTPQWHISQFQVARMDMRGVVGWRDIE